MNFICKNAKPKFIFLILRSSFLGLLFSRILSDTLLSSIKCEKRYIPDSFYLNIRENYELFYIPMLGKK